jgi:hypothetical protein
VQDTLNSLSEIDLWTGLKRIERELSWVPFDVGVGIQIDESFTESRTSKAFLVSIQSDDSETELSYPPRALDIVNPEEESDIEEGLFQELTGSSVPAKKQRSSSVRDTNHNEHHNIKEAPIHAEQQKPISNYATSHKLSAKRTTQKGTASALLGSRFSTGSKLSDFAYVMDKAGKTKYKVSPHFADHHEPLPSRTQTPITSKSSTVLINVTKSAPNIECPAKTNAASIRLSAPPIDLLPATSPVIISQNLTAKRSFFRALQSKQPDATFIIRDFRSHTLYGITTLSDNEADIALSPTVGVIVTNLQKLHQRSLPVQGQKSNEPLKERIQKTAMRYEKLFVLVQSGAGGRETAEGLSMTDVSVLLELSTFAATYSHRASAGDLDILFVGFGDEAAANWVASLMGRFACKILGDDIKVLQDETNVSYHSPSYLSMTS